MKYLEILRKFKEKKIKYFSLQDFQEITGLKYNAVRGLLKRYKKKGLVVNPKKGYYYFKDYAPDDFFLANKLYYPSYISMETVLSSKGVIPETIYPIISITPKSTREFIVENKKFIYQKIKQEVFQGYYKKGNYLVADLEKAVADYLYFIALGRKEVNDRINLKDIDKNKLKEYSQLYKNKKLTRLINKYA
jgi:predicted transcriptional regulator of viral defense system